MFPSNTQSPASCLIPGHAIGGRGADDRRNTKRSITLTYERANAVSQDKSMMVSDSGLQDVKLRVAVWPLVGFSCPLRKEDCLGS
jgi:hypothetical protein